MKRANGFTLLEVVIALSVLAMQLVVLLEVQASALANAGRSRDVTIATLLARSKMIDLEQKLLDEGFTMGVQEERGDFREEGHEEVKWSARVTELELDLSTLTGLCGALGEEQAANCETMLGGLGPLLEGTADELGRSMRLVDLDVKWPEGKGESSLKVRTIVTKEDLGASDASPFADPADPTQGGNGPQDPGAPPGQPPGTPPGTPPRTQPGFPPRGGR